MMRYLLLFLLCSLSTAHAQVIVTDTSTYQHVKHYMKVDKTYCGGIHTVDAIFPYMQSNHYQVVKNPHVFSGGQVRDNAEGGNKYIGYSLHTPELEQLGNVFEIGMDFDVATININVNFDAIDTIYPYDTTSKEYKENTGDLTDCILPHHPHIEAIANELWGQSNDIIDYARRCYEYTATHLNYLDANTGIHSLQSIIDNGGGDCGNFSSYYISLLRNRDIPSRHVVAVMGQDNYHVWAEFYLQDYGWIPVDPTFKHGDPNGDYFGHKNSPHYITTLGIELTDYKFAADSEPMQLQLMQLLYYMWWCYDPCTSTEFNFEIVREKIKTESIAISDAKQVTYMNDKNLDFTGYPDLKAYVATGYDKSFGTIWLTRVKEVPANTGFLLMGEAGNYDIPVTSGGSSSYYMNMFKGTIEGTTIQTTEGDNTNYYLSNGDAGVGFYKVQGSVELKPNRAYLSVPTEIPAVGSEGSTETIKVSAAGQVPYYNSQSLDFSSLDAQGVKAYTATGYDYSSGTIWLTRVKQVPAKTGILIMAPEGEYPVPTASVSSVYANMFRGTLEGTTIQTHEEIEGKDYINYYLSSGASGVGFYRVTNEEGVKIGANRCYLPILNKDAAAGTRSANSDLNQIAFEESDEVIGIQLLRGIGGDENGTTSIKDLTPALSEGEGTWYTLQGQRVAKPGKGLYIKNGKVVVIK